MEHVKGVSLVYVAALLTDNRLGWKGLPRTNTLVYYEYSKITDVKVLEHWALGSLF